MCLGTIYTRIQGQEKPEISGKNLLGLSRFIDFKNKQNKKKRQDKKSKTNKTSKYEFLWAEF